MLLKWTFSIEYCSSLPLSDLKIYWIFSNKIFDGRTWNIVAESAQMKGNVYGQLNRKVCEEMIKKTPPVAIAFIYQHQLWQKRDTSKLKTKSMLRSFHMKLHFSADLCSFFLWLCYGFLCSPLHIGTTFLFCFCIFFSFVQMMWKKESE